MSNRELVTVDLTDSL